MANTKSAKKAIRSSLRKRQDNSFWKNRIRNSVKTISKNLETKKADVAILNENLMVLQKVLDKAAKKKVIHENKAKRLKSRYAKKITAFSQKDTQPQETSAVKKPTRRATSKK